MNPQALLQARQGAARAGRPLLSYLAEHAGIDPRQLIAEVGAACRYRVLGIDDLYALQPDFSTLSYALAMERECLVMVEAGRLLLVTGDPWREGFLSWADAALGKPFQTCLALPGDIAAVLASHGEGMKALDTALPQAEAEISAGSGVEALTIGSVHADASPIVRLTNSTLYDAYRAGASDIHLETTAAGLRIKYRLDGVLNVASEVKSLATAEQVISRFKIMAELDIAERRVPQDGRFKVSINGREVDFRVSIMPSVFGEDAVLRILVAVDVLLATDVKKAAALLRISWDEAWHLMERAVLRGRAAKDGQMPTHIGVDEKAIAKGHRYMTLVCDLKDARVEYIGEERKEASLAAYFEAFPQEAREGIEAIGLDMWPAYIKACREHVPGAEAKMVFDRFHIMRHVVEAVDKVRKQEHKALMKAGDTTLSKSKYLWLTNPANMTDKARSRFEELKAAELKTGRAWALKEALRELWNYTSERWAAKFWRRWYFWATHSRLKPMIEAAKLIARHLPNVLTYFSHRITNAVAEGLNSKIATVQKRACGYRNPDHFKIAVYFHCGGLNLYPAAVTHTKVG